MNPEIVAPMHVVRQLDLQLARRSERLAVDELGLRHLVDRLVDRVVVRTPLPRQRPIDAEDVEHLVDLNLNLNPNPSHSRRQVDFRFP